jgi:hypothetical protein
LRREEKEGRPILIPVKLDKAPTPPLLTERKCLDFTNLFPANAMLLKELTTMAFNNADISDEPPYDSRSNKDGLFIGIDVGTTKIASSIISLSENSLVIEYEKKVRHSAIGAEKETSLRDKILSQALSKTSLSGKLHVQMELDNHFIPTPITHYKLSLMIF